jgi:N-acetylmuramoyl-L-alanine amidase
MVNTIYLSPSTQWDNIGAGNYGTEKDRMNQIGDVVERVLKVYGITVYRNKPSMTLNKIVEDSNNKKPNIHFAIHSNAGGGRGCEVYCHRFGGSGEKLAKLVYSSLAAITPVTDRGVKQGYNFYGVGKHMYELAYTNAPAALVEVAFHDNSEDSNWIINNIESIGIALSKGILSYFGMKYKG